MILGGDYSLYDRVLDWANHNWHYAFIKASEGTVEDPMFKQQWTAARGYVYRSAYHFFRPLVPWKAAAEKFMLLMDREGLGELPPVLDLEAVNGVAKDKCRLYALEWLRYVHREAGVRPIIYTSPYYANTLIEMWREPEFADYLLWQATYPWDEIKAGWTEQQRRETIHMVLTGQQRYIFPRAARPWEDVGRSPLWAQWTGKCPPEYVPGYPLGEKKAVDVNYYRFDLNEMKMRFDLKELDRKGDGEVSTKPTTWTALLRSGQSARLRSGAGTENAIKETLTAPATSTWEIKGTGTKLGPFRDTSTGIDYYWGEVTLVNGLAKSGFVAFTTSLTNVVWLATPPAPPQNPATRKVVRSVLFFDDGSTEELYPKL